MTKRMTRGAAAIVAATGLICLALSGCATPAAKARAAQSEADLNAPIVKPSSQVQKFRLKDWTAPNDHTLILVSEDGTRYRAETLGPCMGLDFAHRVGFVNRGGFGQIDRFSSVVLDDGTRCPFQSFDEVKSAESKALDSYEKAHPKSAQDSSGHTDDPKPQ